MDGLDGLVTLRGELRYRISWMDGHMGWSDQHCEENGVWYMG
jgi:hypothetical protein